MFERYVAKRALVYANVKPLVPATQQHQPTRFPPSPELAVKPKLVRSASGSGAAPHKEFLRNAPHRSLGKLHAPISLALRQPARSRSLTTSAVRKSQTPFEFLTGYSFSAKPRLPEDEPQQQDDSPRPPSQPVEIGFPADSEVGQWRNALLRGGEAGEDALMCTDMGAPGDKVIGVADGVGGWTENGVDPSLFSQALMFYATKRAQATCANPDRINDADLADVDGASPKPVSGCGPKEILTEAYDHVLKEPLVVAGSATACIITLDSIRGTLRSANLGDSGFVILRQGSGKHGVLHASQPQQFGFNTPLQLAKLPPELVQEGSISNKPRDADTWECSLRHGDLIIVGTDGLFDNVDAKIELPQFAKFIKEKHHASYQSRHAGKQTDSLAEDREFVDALATNLVEYAKICQNSTTKQSPFEREAARYGIHYPGGKVDDIAVVCCLVVER